MHPVLFRIPLPFHLGHLDIAVYGVMTALGALFGVLTGVSRAKRSGVRTNDVLDLALWVLIAGILGARIFYLISDMDWAGESKSLLNILKVFFKFRQGGLVFYGGLLLAIPVGIAFLRVKKLPLWRLADVAAPSIALGEAFARIGCYLNGCCWGKRCPIEFPFHVTFPEGSLSADYYGEANIPLYPTQFISSLTTAILFVVLAVIYGRKKFDGQVFWLYGVLYGVTRFLIEFLRGDNKPILFGALTISQGVSLLLVLTSLVMLFVLRARAARNSEAAVPRT